MTFPDAGTLGTPTEGEARASTGSGSFAAPPRLSQHPGDLISRHDAQGKYLEVSPSSRELLGYEPAELIGRDGYELIHPDDAGEVGRLHEAVLRGEPARTVTFRVRQKAGTFRWVEAVTTVVRDVDGGVLEFLVDARDVTARKHAEDALRTSRRFLQSVIDNASSVVYVKDLEGRYLLINREYENLFGVDRREFEGRTDYDLFEAEVAAKLRANDGRVCAEGRPINYEEEVPCPDGVRVYLSVKFPLLDDHGRVMAVGGISTDITDRKRDLERLRKQNDLLQEAIRSERHAHETLKRAEVQLIQAEKLSALGLMVAGIAHEVNNPLSFATNNLAVLRRDLALLLDLLAVYRKADGMIAGHDPELARRIAELSEDMDLDYTLGNLAPLLTRTAEGLGRIQRTVRDLRDFVRPDEGDLCHCDLNAGVRTTASVISPRARQQGVQVELDLRPLPEVTCHPSQINQAVLNLVANAIDACAGGGTVTISTRPSGETGAEIEVRDDGPGIPESIRDRILDPFFTTKAIGQGTGLGLSVADGIARAHGGSLTFETETGRGTAFRLTLPADRPASADEASQG